MLLAVLSVEVLCCFIIFGCRLFVANGCGCSVVEEGGEPLLFDAVIVVVHFFLKMKGVASELTSFKF